MLKSKGVLVFVPLPKSRMWQESISGRISPKGGHNQVVMKPSHFNIPPEIAADAHLVRHGPYELTRHPMYTALLMATAAPVVDEFSLLRLCTWGCLLIVLLMKLSYEEQLLAERFPEYKIYMEQTKRLLPFLY